ncbi:MAG: sulfatase [Planctomycetaceae bacterium]|nr:sulfatase [Planctomycetaceae bacterium]
MLHQILKCLNGFVLIAFLSSIGVCQGSDRPSVVFILVDDLGWSDLGCYGNKAHRTPHIDRLAAEGMRFTDAYSPAPICSASRASILTGKTVPRLRFEFVTKNEAGHQRLDTDVPLETPPFTLNLPLEERTVAERLSTLGYETAFLGKWHVSQHYQQRYLAWHPKFGPRAQGFSLADEDFGDHPYAWQGRPRPADLPHGQFPQDTVIQRAAEFIRQDHAQPFFLMTSLYHVHTPVKNRCRWLVNEYEGRIPADSPNCKKRLEYAAFVETMDHHVGTILDAIEASGRRENTLVVLLSDNGGHPEYCANAPLRGSKWNLYEGGIRVPMLARWPGHIEAASTCSTPVIGYDLLPTFVDLAGGQAEDVDGLSLAELFTNPDANWSRSLIWHFPYYHPESSFSIAIEQIGVNDFAVSQTRPQSALRRGNHKLIKFAEDGRTELYNLSEDISEQHDLSRKLPARSHELNTELEQKLDAMQARRAIPRQD